MDVNIYVYELCLSMEPSLLHILLSFQTVCAERFLISPQAMTMLSECKKFQRASERLAHIQIGAHGGI